jgi:sigma-B regulation protein RsbU (phosphoserine phosphatase)
MMKRPVAESSHLASGDPISSQLELLAEMSREFVESLDIDATLLHAIERITNHVQADGGALFLLDEATGTLRCHACVGASEITGLTLKADEGIVGRCVQGNCGEIVRNVANDPNFFADADASSGFTTRSILCAPMSVKEKRIGAIELVNKRGGDGLFVDADLQFLKILSSSAALAIVNARMAQALVDQERVRRELELAAEIQRSLLPVPQPPPFPVQGVNVPAREVSGDFYDFFALEDGRICFIVGDVSGKGMNAALLMAKTAALFRCLGKTIHEPGALFAVINDEICETASRGMFATTAGGLYNPESGRVKLVNAGHEPPLHRQLDGSYVEYPAEAPPLGVLLGGEFPEVEFDLAEGTLYIFTDGVTEGYIADGEALEVDGLKALLDATNVLPADRRLASVVAAIDRGLALRDDVTLLALGVPPLFEYFGPAVASELKSIRDGLGAALTAQACDDAFVKDVVLVVDEACQNVIRHAYKDVDDGEMAINLRRKDESLIILLRDFAKTVDPATIVPRDLEDIRPGGLGTHFINEVMDEVTFLPPPGGYGNLLRLVKRIGG